MRGKSNLYAVLLVAGLLLLLFVFGQTALAQTPEPIGTEESESVEPTATSLMDEIVITRTPEPTVTPGAIYQEVENLAAATGLNEKYALGVSGTDWINLVVSVLFVLAAYLLGTVLIQGVLPKVVGRTPSTFDDELLQKIGPSLRWLLVVLVLNFATRRLAILSPELKRIMGDVYFVLALILVVRMVWLLVDLANEWYRAYLTEQERLEQLDPVLVLLVRLAQVVIVIIGATVLLSNFGINVTAFAAALGLGGLAFSLAARDTIADAIAGFIILVDQPFRIGDRIEIQGIGTWGDVVDIGLRTTRIRTRDNRMVIVPNSTIGSNQIVNYTFPDPQYRIQTHVGVAYGTDIEMVRHLIVDTVQQVEGVLPDKPVDALYVEMGDSAMTFRVRWWIESYVDTRRMFDRVHTVLQRALDDAGVESPFPTQTLNVEISQDAGQEAE